MKFITARQKPSPPGFTLIELLTVIAIIAILTAVTAVALPRALERGKITSTIGAFDSISKAMLSYNSGNRGSFPPGYGFIDISARSAELDEDNEEAYYVLKPYLAYLGAGFFGNESMTDYRWSESFDTDGDGRINVMEFSPMGTEGVVGALTFPTERYDGTNLQVEVQRQLDRQKGRPYIYAPVNKRQYNYAKTYWVRTGDFLATKWDKDSPFIKGKIIFPPTDGYDAYVLISLGPGGQSYGLLGGSGSSDGRLGNEDEEHIYHVRALRAYFLATRDMNNNKVLDFDFEARSKQGEAALEYNVPGTNQNTNNMLPDPNNAAGYGPLIYVSK